MKKFLPIVCLFFLFSTLPVAADSHATLTFTAGASAFHETKDPKVLTTGTAFDIRLYFFKHEYDHLQPGILFNYSSATATNKDELNITELGMLYSFQTPLIGRLAFRQDICTGAAAASLQTYSTGQYDETNGPGSSWAPFVSSNTALSWYMSPNWAILSNLYVSYGFNTGWNGEISLGASFQIPKSTSELEVLKIETTTVVPAFKNYYLDSPVLRIDVKNNEHFPISKLTVNVERGTLNDSTTFIFKKTIKPGKTESIYVPVKWNDAILYRTQTSMESLTLSINYQLVNKTRTAEETATCLVLGRNNFIWQSAADAMTDEKLSHVISADDSKTAVFVNPNDPVLVSISHDIKEKSDSSLSYDGLPAKFRSINNVVSYLQSRNITYQVDPDSVPYGDSTAQTDYLRYPSDTLDAGYGDCDDLSILTASLLEAAGVPTSFITVPGHIYVAADSGLTEDNASFLFGSANDFISDGTTLWLPIEVTSLNKGFSFSWKEGMKEWNATGETDRKFYPLEKAWETYKPVASTWWARRPSAYKPADSFGCTANTNRSSVAEPAIKQSRAQSLELMNDYSAKEKSSAYSPMAKREFTFGSLDQAYDDIKHAVSLDNSYSNCFNAALIARTKGNTESAKSYLTQAIAIKNTEKAQTLLQSLSEKTNTDTVQIAETQSSGGTTRADEKGATTSWEE